MVAPSRLLIAALLIGGLCGPASAETVTTDYSLRIFGVPIGQSSFDTTVEDGRYSIRGTMRSSGIARLFSSTDGTTSASGQETANGFRPNRYSLNYAVDGKRYASDVTYSGASVASAKVAPSRSEADKDSYVPLSRAQVQRAIDPLSGLLVKTDSAASVCGRTLPFYDGWSRMDVSLSTAGRQTFSMNGYSGDAVVCNVRLKPVGGYDSESKGLKYLTSRTIEVWFAPIAQPDVYVPVYAEIPTKVGTLVLSATRVAKS